VCSSDLIRRYPRTGSVREWVLDCRLLNQPIQERLADVPRLRVSAEPSPALACPDLWLRNGDVIEVPEK
jgi:hypothetical protein